MDKLFGIAGQALGLAEKRTEMLSSNLVNSSTPNYKARDFDFAKALQNANQSTGLQTSNAKHIAAQDGPLSALDVKYRIPMQTSLDGNTVDPEIERKNFMQNNLKYQLSLGMVQGKANEIMRAIKGE